MVKVVKVEAGEWVVAVRGSSNGWPPSDADRGVASDREVALAKAAVPGREGASVKAAASGREVSGEGWAADA